MLPSKFNTKRSMTFRCVVTVFILSFCTQHSFGQSLAEYRWFKLEKNWCVDVDKSRFCMPFEVNVDDIGPGKVSFVEIVADHVVPNRILFTHDGSLGFSGVERTDERVTLVDSYDLPGALAKKFLVGTSYVLEMELVNGVRVDLYGSDFNELYDIALLIASTWQGGQE